MRLTVHSALSGILALIIPSDAWAEPLYRDGSWGVVPQDGGSTCVVVLNSEDRRKAFHFIIDGQQKAASVGILDRFFPDLAPITASTMVIMDLGPQFTRPMKFKRHFDGSLGYLSADLAVEDLDSILEALRSVTRGVSLSFENGETWLIPPPKSEEEAASAIAKCWNEARRGLHA